MSAASMNVFALLDDEGTVDAGELAAKLPVATKEPVKKATTETKPAGSARPAGRAADTKPKGGRPRSGGAGGDDAPAINGEGGPAARSQGGRSNGRSRGGRGRGDGDRRKRDFDRHDASGRGHETEKRHGQGRGNWGAEGEETNEDLEKKLHLTEEGDEGAASQEKEEEEKQLSLEEYEALMAEKRAALNESREPAVKVDAKQFDGMKTFAKEEFDAGLGLSKNVKVLGANKTGKEKERKEREVLTDVGFRVANNEVSSGGRGGRGGRGGGRGGGRPRSARGGERGGERGAGRGGRGPAIRIDDASAFPSLA